MWTNLELVEADGMYYEFGLQARVGQLHKMFDLIPEIPIFM